VKFSASYVHPIRHINVLRDHLAGSYCPPPPPPPHGHTSIFCRKSTNITFEIPTSNNLKPNQYQVCICWYSLIDNQCFSTLYICPACKSIPSFLIKLTKKRFAILISIIIIIIIRRNVHAWDVLVALEEFPNCIVLCSHPINLLWLQEIS
jgi:hypothetical protein